MAGRGRVDAGTSATYGRANQRRTQCPGGYATFLPAGLSRAHAGASATRSVRTRSTAAIRTRASRGVTARVTEGSRTTRVRPDADGPPVVRIRVGVGVVPRVDFVIAGRHRQPPSGRNPWPDYSVFRYPWTSCTRHCPIPNATCAIAVRAGRKLDSSRYSRSTSAFCGWPFVGRMSSRRPDERIRAMRRRLARRAQLVRARSRAKNEIHAVLMRCLKDAPGGVGSVRRQGAGLAGRAAAGALRARDGRLSFLDTEIAEVEKPIAVEALSWPEVKRLMTVPGVNVIVAATFMAAVGDIRRFGDRRKLTAYLGLDPRVRQSGVGPATPGHISKQGSSSARHALVEASWSTVRPVRPIAGFYQRIKARRGHSIAIVASARKLACLFWCLLTRGEDYAFAQPSLTTKKMRRLELAAGAPRRQGGRDVWSTNTAMRTAERDLALQAQRAYERTVADWQAAAPAKVGASATPGRASQQPSKGQAARQTTSP